MSSDTKTVTPEEVLTFTGPTKGFLCPLSANTFNIDFIELKIKNADTNSTVCVAGRDPNTAPMREFPPGFDLDILRQIKYNFPRSLLDCSCVNTTLVFQVTEALSDVRLIERHYFGDTLVKSYDFSFPFCAPNSTNSWDTEYEFPQLDAGLKAKIAAGSYADNQADTFIFVGGRLIMHNKAYIRYVPDAETSLETAALPLAPGEVIQ